MKTPNSRLNALVSPDMKMAEVVHLNYNLVTVFNRFGIKLGFGEKTVEEVCRTYQVNLDFFLAMANVFHDPEYFPRQQLQKFSVDLLVNYLRSSHRHYLEDRFPQFERLMGQLSREAGHDAAHLGLLWAFLNEYRDELTVHMRQEEELIFPYIAAVERACLDGAAPEILVGQVRRQPMQKYSHEHDDAERKLLDMKNIVIKYMPPPQRDMLYNQLLFELFRFEKDLKDHARIEDKVLVPKVMELEKALLAAAEAH